MDNNCLDYIEEVITKFEIEEPIIDFGGATVLADFFGCVRNIFKGKDYKVFDQGGPDVDIIGDIYDIDIPDNSIGTALCLNTIEHLAEPQKAIDEMARVLRPNGRIIITAPMSWGIHRYPKDYWRFLPDGMEYLLRDKFADVEIKVGNRNRMSRLIFTTARRV